MKQIKRRRRSSVNEALGNRMTVGSLRHLGYRAHKISDVMGTSFTDKKPYDIFACSPKGRSIAIEGKMIKKWQKLNYKDFQPQQLVELDKQCLECKGRAFVFLYVFIEKMRVVCVLDWQLYHKQIKTDEGITVEQLRKRSVGRWFNSSKDNWDKDIFNIKGFMK